MPDQPKATVYDTLELLCQSGEIPRGMRPYRVKSGGLWMYPLANSPKAAAEACCTVERVTDKEINECLLKMQAKTFRERLDADELAGEDQTDA